MVVYNFKGITVVPTAKDFIDIVLSKTQRKTPTVVHPQYQISRIRHFYMRKVKFSQQTFHDRLSKIVEEFPLLDDIHPFYANLINILYDRDHYKLALGQINICRHLIDNIAKDYCKLLKYGDSLYRCKQLKKAALGRMATLMKKQASSLAYLEQVRQHLARLPSIEPNTRTLILCGYPNVGKSSFMNKVTRAEVDVQPYAFTTKSLFVGHTDYKYSTWQVIDTPGILDHPLEERNTIEMQSITAMAHLRAAILYVMDLSEQCGYSIKQQIALFNSIKPLFSGKPIVLALNKIDVVQFESIPLEDQAAIKELEKEGATLVRMSTMTEEGVSLVKQTACEKLLEQRVDTAIRNKKVHDAMNKLHLAMPAPRDTKTRPPIIPESVLKAKQGGMEVEITPPPKTEEELEDEQKPEWMRGLESKAWKRKYLLKNEDWRFDIIPEIKDGHNIIDYVDPEILEKLDELEKEEELRDAEEPDEEMELEDELNSEEEGFVKEIRQRKGVIIQENRLAKSRNHSSLPDKNSEKQLSSFESHLKELGIDPTTASERLRERSRSKSRGRKRARSESQGAEGEAETKVRRTTSSSRPPREQGLKDEKQVKRVEKVARKALFQRNKEGRTGEGDRIISTKKPRHLFSGTRTVGKTDRR